MSVLPEAPGLLRDPAAPADAADPPDATAPAIAPGIAGLVGALLSNPRRPDPRRLPQPREPGPSPADAATPTAPAEAVATELPTGLLVPTGLGTAAARRFAQPQVAEPAAPGAAAPSAESDDDMPELFCPGPLRDDPALGAIVDEGVVAWAEEVGIYPGNLDRLRRAQFGRLIMLTHPACNDPDRLLAAAKCVVAEWAADDYYVDEVSLGADPRIVGSRLAKLYAVVDPAGLPAKYQPQLDAYRREEAIATAFRTAMEHLARYTSSTQMGRFQHQMGILFVAWSQEADWHLNGRTPPVWEYLVQRHLNSYLPPMILIDPVAGYELSAYEFYEPRVRRAFTMAGAANVLLNDLHSAGFESETDFNLPRVIAAEDKCSHREAIRRTVLVHNELMHTFVDEAAALTAIGSPALRRFFMDTWAWLGGSREWHATSARYKEG